MYIHLRNVTTGRFLGVDSGAGAPFDSAPQAGPYEIIEICNLNGFALSRFPTDGEEVTLRTPFRGTTSFWSYWLPGPASPVVEADSPSYLPPPGKGTRFRVLAVSSGGVGHGSTLALMAANKHFGLEATGARRRFRLNGVTLGAADRFEIWEAPAVGASGPSVPSMVPMLRGLLHSGQGVGTLALRSQVVSNGVFPSIAAPPGGCRVFLQTGGQEQPESVDAEVTCPAGETSTPFGFLIRQETGSTARARRAAVQFVDWARSEVGGNLQDAFAAPAAQVEWDLQQDLDQCYLDLVDGPFGRTGFEGRTGFTKSLSLRWNPGPRDPGVLQAATVAVAGTAVGVSAGSGGTPSPRVSLSQGNLGFTLSGNFLDAEGRRLFPEVISLSATFTVRDPSPYYCRGRDGRSPLDLPRPSWVQRFVSLVMRLLGIRTPARNQSLTAVFRLREVGSDVDGFPVDYVRM